MRFVLIIFIACLSAGSYGQIIRGKVIDNNSEQAVNAANVYFSGTFKGTQTDSLGIFELDGSLHPGHTIVVSVLGYYSANVWEYPTDEHFQVKLEPKTYSIEEIHVVYDRSKALRNRKRNMRYFEKEFLGNDYNARKCKILNPEVIEFYTDQNDSVFEVYANKPIVIHNAALGYTLVYHLDSFAKTDWGVHYQGSHYFIADVFKQKRQDKRAQKRREKAFKGSRMHFVRALYAGNASEEGFLMCDSTGRALENDSLIEVIDDHVAVIKHRGALEYYYYPDKGNLMTFSASYLYIKHDSLLISKEGFFDPLSNYWSGRTGKERVGRMLPYEYRTSEQLSVNSYQ